MLTLSIPGKLLLAGEYAVLEPGYPCLVMAVNRFVTVEAFASSRHLLTLPSLGLSDVEWHAADGYVEMMPNNPRLRFVKQAIETVMQYIDEPERLSKQPFSMVVTSNLDEPESGMKLGLGSSAAVVVAVISALLELYGHPRDPIKLFKLAAITHLQVQGNGSGADIAASVFGGIIRYTTFNPVWLTRQLEHSSIPTLVNGDWPYFTYEQVEWPEALALSIGWTKSTSRTGPLVAKIQDFQTAYPEEYGIFLRASREAVDGLVQSLRSGQWRMAMEAIRANRMALLKLGEQAGVPIETPAISRLISIAEKYGGVGKSSGAGGGDCGIAVLDRKESVPALHRNWSQSEILPLDLEPFGGS